MLQLTRWERKKTHDFGPVGGETYGYITVSRFATGQEKADEVARTPERVRSGRTPARSVVRKISYPVSRTTLLTETRLPPPEYIPPEGPT